MAMVSCTPKVPSRYIQPDDMEELLYDLHISMAMANEAAHKEGDLGYQQNLYFAAVLEKHGVTKADFDSSLIYYYSRADRFSDIYKRVVERLSNEAMELGASEGEINRYANLNANGDTTNIWTGDLSTILVPYAPFNLYTFEQKADTSFRKGDSFMFIINTEYIFQSGSRNAQACITVRYENDTIVSRTSSLSSSGISQIRVPENGDLKAKDIRGYIYLTPEKEPTTVLKLMSVKGLQLIKFRKQSKTGETKTEQANTGQIKSEQVKAEPVEQLKTDGQVKAEPLKLEEVKTEQLKIEDNESENPTGSNELPRVRRVGSLPDVHGPVPKPRRNGL